MDKRVLIGIFLGIICFYFLSSLGVTILGYPETKSLKYILGVGGIIFVFSTFTSGFVSAWVAKKKEIFVSFLYFFISYTPWIFFQYSDSRQTFWVYQRERINIFAPYIVLIFIAISGGFVAKKIRQKQEKDSGD